MKQLLKKIYRTIPYKKNIFQATKKIWKPSPNIYQHLHFQDKFKVEIDKEHSFMIQHHGFQVENEIFWSGITGGWEKVSLGLWIELCKTSNTILDIGANTGVYSLIAKSINPLASVYAFEPVSRVFNKLIHNNTINNYDIVCIEKAVSDSDGEAVIFDTGGEHTYSVTVNKNLNQAGTPIYQTTISTIQLSTFIESNSIKAIDLMKIDVETHEPEVLIGMGAYLQKYQPTLLIEVLNEEVASQLNKILSQLPYLFFNIDENKGIRQVENINKSDYYNFLCCSRQVAGQLNLL